MSQGAVLAATEGRTSSGGLASVVRKGVGQALAFVSLIALIIFFAFANPSFLTFTNVSSIMLATAVIAILALGQTLVIITGGIDLTVGFGMTLASVMTALVMSRMGLPIWMGVLVGILTGALIGTVNGIAVAYLKLPPMIATLAIMMICQGLALILSGVKPVYTNGIPGFNQIALGTPLLGIPNAVWITIVLTVLAWVILGRTVLGRFTYAIGSNEEATRLSGINTNRWKLAVYMLAGCFTGAAGVIMASRLNSAQPQLGAGYEMQAIAAVVIGGTSLLGGRGSIIGTLIGALVMGVLVNGLRIMAVQTEWQTVLLGLVILVAVYTDNLRMRRSGII